jgi:hypothetical protein
MLYFLEMAVDFVEKRQWFLGFITNSAKISATHSRAMLASGVLMKRR